MCLSSLWPCHAHYNESFTLWQAICQWAGFLTLVLLPKLYQEKKMCYRCPVKYKSCNVWTPSNKNGLKLGHGRIWCLWFLDSKTEFLLLPIWKEKENTRCLNQSTTGRYSWIHLETSCCFIFHISNLIHPQPSSAGSEMAAATASTARGIKWRCLPCFLPLSQWQGPRWQASGAWQEEACHSSTGL